MFLSYAARVATIRLVVPPGQFADAAQPDMRLVGKAGNDFQLTPHRLHEAAQRVYFGWNDLAFGKDVIQFGVGQSPYHESILSCLIVNEPMPEIAPPSVAENIDKIIRVETDALERRSSGEAMVDAIGGFVGTMRFVLFQILAGVGWVTLNSVKLPGIMPVDPFPFPLLSSFASFEAVLIAAFVLMKQNRISVIVARRDHLDLQVNLRTERQATQIIQMLDRLSAHVGFQHDHDASGLELGQHVAIEHLVDELHRRLPDAAGG